VKPDINAEKKSKYNLLNIGSQRRISSIYLYESYVIHKVGLIACRSAYGHYMKLMIMSALTLMSTVCKILFEFMQMWFGLFNMLCNISQDKKHKSH